MGNLLDQIQDHELKGRYEKWRQKPLPSLEGVKEVFIDCETDGLEWWNGKKLMAGFSLFAPDAGIDQYVSVRHPNSDNIDIGTVRSWAREHLPGKRIVNQKTGFDVQVMYNDDIDLVDLGCTLGDVSHYAALLDDHRRVFNQAQLLKDYGIDEEKVTVVDGTKLDPSRMAKYPAGLVDARARSDTRGVWKLKEKMWRQLTEQDLHRVRALEEQVIAPTCEMERNGAPINVEKAERWERELQTKAEEELFKLWRETGLKLNPDSNTDCAKLFKHRGVPITAFTEAGRPSFTAEALSHVEDPVLKKLAWAGKLLDLKGKVTKILKSLDNRGHVRYALHQLRGDEGGTVQGRFSSSALLGDFGINVQQQMAVGKHHEIYGEEFGYYIRELFEERYGLIHWSADAAQIEYRIFADKARTPKVIEAYSHDLERIAAGEEPLSFHKMVWEMLKVLKPDLAYKPLKNLNFAKIYGAGLAKIAFMMGFISWQQFVELNNKYAREQGMKWADRPVHREILPDGTIREWKGKNNDPLLDSARAVEEIYKRELPEAQALIDYASKLAGERGYVRTAMGRRIRFFNGQRLHKALNGVIQGTAADIMKLKLVRLHEVRKEHGLVMRHTEHDETNNGVPDAEMARRLHAILNEQEFPQMKVPIVWESSTGANWKECA
jgi:DNA polymerase I-like protein with 3'-5' exonuclease and polymerase domains